MNAYGTPSGLALPRTLDEVEPGWLSSALSEYVPGTVVRSVDVVKVVHGTATNARLRVQYDKPGKTADLPEALWLKAGFETHSAQTAVLGVYETEAFFYRHLASKLPVDTPTCYYAGRDPLAHQGLVLLEDLGARAVTFGKATEPAGPQIAAGVIDALARLHAATWEDDSVAGLPYVWRGIPSTGTGSQWFLQQTPEVVAGWIEQRREVDIPPEVNDPERIVAAFWRLAERTTEGPLCLLHSDPHIDNLYFENGTPGFLDFQSLRFSSFAWDLSYFVVKSMEVHDRRNNEEALVRRYLDRLNHYGVRAPSFDEAWLAYRRYVVYALFCAIVNPDSFKPREINIAWMSRSVAAAADLRSFEALGV
jgi:Phosphotransferase enzyme family